MPIQSDPNKYIDLDGQHHSSMSKMCAKYGIAYTHFHYLVSEKQYTIEEALKEMVAKKRAETLNQTAWYRHTEGRKQALDFIKKHYEGYNEDERLKTRHGQIEYMTTMKYIQESLSDLITPKIIEIGAGTGRYSITLARFGHDVTAVELLEHHIDIMKSKLNGNENIQILQKNAMDLSGIPDETYDVTLLLGPMYHVYNNEDKQTVLKEAIRITKPGGRILVAYCMNDPTVVQYIFEDRQERLNEPDLFTNDWHFKSKPEEIFEMYRVEDINELNKDLPVTRIKLVATDGPTNYIRNIVDNMDDRIFGKYLDYHLVICERQDMIGASHHTLDILQKQDAAS